MARLKKYGGRKTYRKKSVKKAVAASAAKRRAAIQVLRAKPVVSRIARKVIRNMSETKNKYTDLGKVELYHQNGKNPANSMVHFILNQNNSTYMPTQGTGDGQRIGDKISISGWKIRMMLAHKGDRPNITFRIVVYQTRQNAGTQYDQIFRNDTNNFLLDTWDPDQQVKVLFDKTIKRGPGDYSLEQSSATKEYTFPFKFFVKAPQKNYTFTTDGGFLHQHGFINLCVFAFDAYGTVGTDNIAYYQAYSNMYYKDL